MLKTLYLILLAILTSSIAYAQPTPLLDESIVRALTEELSGETAKRNLEFLARQHRMRGSEGFHAAADFIAGQLRSYGLHDVSLEQFPADGKRFYGTQKSRRPWDAEFAELWELQRDGDQWTPYRRLASWDAMPVSLAQDSESSDVTAELTDIGRGTSEADYVGKNITGKMVLTSSQPGAVADLAVGRYGAVGIVSYAQNQRSAWWGENENLVRWGHLTTFSETKTFGFMVSLKQARALQQRLAQGESIRLHAVVRAGQHDGYYEVLTATIPGSDPDLKNEEIVFSCHLDHQRPGSNDNASGSVTILEVARTLQKLINEKKIPQPARTIRFIWPPEIEGTVVFLNAHPEITRRMKAAIHMDMVGGGQETKAVFHVTRGPMSLPSFIYDVAEAFGGFVNEQSDAMASTGQSAYRLHAPEGGKEALQAEFVDFTSGSDHQVYSEGSFRIPAIYMNDWPDRYIHTNFDTPAMIDPTKLKRSGFIGAAAGYFLATLSAQQARPLWTHLQAQVMRRTARMFERRNVLDSEEADNLARIHFWYERNQVASVSSYTKISDGLNREIDDFFMHLEALAGTKSDPSAPSAHGTLVFNRNPDVKGPMSVFGYNYFTDHYGGARASMIRLFRHQGLRGAGGAYAYETLNLVDGLRTTQAIRDFVAAEYGPVPGEMIVEYLRALEEIGIVTEKP